MTTYSLKSYINDLRSITKEYIDQNNIIEKIKPLAKKIALNRDWIKPEYYNVDPEQGFGLHLLHEEQDHKLAIFAIAWAPNKGLAPHNHKTWAVVAGIQGQEHETNYTRVDDGSKPGYANLIKSHEETFFLARFRVVCQRIFIVFGTTGMRLPCQFILMACTLTILEDLFLTWRKRLKYHV